MQKKNTEKKGLKRPSVRLGSSVVPTRYKLTLAPDLDAGTFKGEERIDVVIFKGLREITLHSKDLEILASKISFAKTDVFAKKISYDAKRETATLLFEKIIPKGKAKLSLEFRGLLSDSLRGFYKSKYMHEGVERTIATTQFEATDARRAFPCFDEPAHKAVFHVSLVVPSNKTAISNTLPIATREHTPGYQIIDFAPTPKMSTYLLAFIIGDFEFLERKTKSGVKVRVFTTAGKKHQGKFALDTTVRCLEFYESYFGIPYPLDTLDTIALPDFESAAMENWGAITYRESALLVDDEHTSLSSKQWTAIVICHELAHQWFGNLVTMEWWTDLWLNEGFASYIEYLAADKLFPEWKLWEQFVAIDLAIALRLDSLQTTHPIEVDVHDPSEIGEIFDEISYQKGASVIRMLAEYIGERDFRDGLRYYLKKHSYKNTLTTDLWDAFEKISKKPVKKMMHVWTRKGGHPVVSVEEKRGQLVFSQERFFRSAISKKNAKDKTLWPIPLSIFAGSEHKVTKVFMERRTYTMPKPNTPWLKLNTDETGVYRTKYSPELLKTLHRPIEEMKLTPEDRLGIIRDLFALTEAGEMPTDLVLEFVASYRKETSYIVWSEILSGLSRVKNLYHGAEWTKGYDAYVRWILDPIVTHIGFEKKESEAHSDTLLRSMVLSVASAYGVPRVVTHAKRLFQKGKVHPDLRGFVYVAYARHGGETNYKRLLALYKSETLHEEKNRLAGAMTHFRDKTLLARTLDFSLSSNVRTQDAPSIIAGVLMNQHGRDIAWKFIKANWKELLNRYGMGGHTLSRVVKPVGFFVTEKTAKDVQAFFKKHAHPGAERAVAQALEGIRANAMWREKEKKVVKKFAQKYK